MRQPKINARDLKDPGHLFVFYPGQWSPPRSGDAQYRYPLISVYRTYGDGKYRDLCFMLKGQTHRDRPNDPDRAAYCWDLDIKTADLTDPGFLRFLAAWKAVRMPTNRDPYPYHGAEVFQLLRALRIAKIPRFVLDKDTDRHAPRKYKGREAAYTTAREVVAA